MKKNWGYSLFKNITKLVLFFTFRERRVLHANRVPKKNPVLFVSNHQNGLMDAIQIPTTINREVHFMTRADVFKNPTIGKFLRSLNLIPIYRLRDGRAKLALNKKILADCAELLIKGETLQMFPEGNHHAQRYLRPFKNGFAEVAFMALERKPDLPLKIIPVGLNYNSGHGFPATIAIIYGKPIDARDYYDPQNLKDSIISLKEAVLQQMQILTTHIPKEEYDKLLEQLKDEGIDFLNPKAANALIASRNFKGGKQKIDKRNVWENFVYYIFTLTNLPPLLLWWNRKKGIKDLAFVNTFRFVFVWVVFPLYYLFVAGVISYFLDSGLAWWYLGFSILLGYLRKRLPVAFAVVKI